MSQAQPVSYQDHEVTAFNPSRPEQQLASANIIPLRGRRVALPVMLDGPKADALLATLIHSPLGVYIRATTSTKRDEICVTLDIAREDLDFTLHTLISTLPEGTIGTLTTRGVMRAE
ncbi:hypothetical protein PQQ72_13680 [Paraburkholderia strydomiana]|jgi:hypothetical protein|uniref:hypothetical protein n=1 Tax=Paraburkholderia strydomiana TaxID=1245417 RepID=UPI0038B74B05